jgi:hypothetical protein
MININTFFKVVLSGITLLAVGEFVNAKDKSTSYKEGDALDEQIRYMQYQCGVTKDKMKLDLNTSKTLSTELKRIESLHVASKKLDSNFYNSDGSFNNDLQNSSFSRKRAVVDMCNAFDKIQIDIGHDFFPKNQTLARAVSHISIIVDTSGESGLSGIKRTCDLYKNELKNLDVNRSVWNGIKSSFKRKAIKYDFYPSRPGMALHGLKRNVDYLNKIYFPSLLYYYNDLGKQIYTKYNQDKDYFRDNCLNAPYYTNQTKSTGSNPQNTVISFRDGDDQR